MVQLADTVVSKTTSCEFESHQAHSIRRRRSRSPMAEASTLRVDKCRFESDRDYRFP